MGATLAMVRAYLLTAPRASELGLFMDWGSLPQKPRTEEETRSFAAALQVMLSLYASVTGTAVIQCKHVPPRPALFDGCLCLYDELQEGEAAALRDELAGLLQGEGQPAVGCTVELVATVAVHRLRFDTHEQAERALGLLREQGRAADFEFNDRAYDGVGGRGWCIAEQGASKAVAAHLKAARHSTATAQPERFRVAEASRPKVCELNPSGGVIEVELEVVPERTVFGACWPRKRGHAEGATPSEYLSQALEAIEHAAFTGKGDKPKVQLLLAKLEWLIRSAVEEDASISGRGGRTVDPAVVRRSRERAKKEERDDDGVELLTLRREV